MVEEVTGINFEIFYSDRRPGDPAKLVCEDVERSEKILKFKPKYGLEEIISTAYRWESIQRRTPNATIGVSD
jgi:UDP-glucose 4-epimerase